MNDNLSERGEDIGKDGDAHCRMCGMKYWCIPPAMYEDWVRGGYKPMSQTIHTAAYLTHFERYHSKKIGADGHTELPPS